MFIFDNFGLAEFLRREEFGGAAEASSAVGRVSPRRAKPPIYME